MFQEALIESLPHRNWRVPTILTSASLHALALGPLVWISMQTVRKVEDPPPPMIFIAGGRPPALGDGGSSEVAPKTRERLTRLPQTAAHLDQFQPTHPPVRDEARSNSMDAQDIREANTVGVGQEADGRKGRPDGVEGSTGDGKEEKDGLRDNAVPLERVDQAPFLISRIEPLYPEAARKIHLSGVVILQAVIGTSGHVEELRVVKSAGALLDDAALSDVERWIYRPAVLDGRPVAVRLAVYVEFALH